MDSLSEKLLFDFGKAVLGHSSGGLIAKLKRLCGGIDGARIALKMAADKSDPREYIGAVIKEKEQNKKANCLVPIVDKNGHGWIHDGIRWKEI